MSTTSTTADSHKNPAALEREVEAVRDRLSNTVDALGARFSPGDVLDQVLGVAKEHGGEFGHNLGNQVKQNPLPLLLTGIGLVWMMSGAKSPTVSDLTSHKLTSSNPASPNTAFDSHPGRAAPSNGSQTASTGSGNSSSGLGSQVKDGVTSAGQKLASGATGVKEGIASSASNLKHSVAEHTSTAKDAVANTAASVQENARTAAHKAQAGFSQMLDEQPLMMAALGVAVGAALGAMLPTTQREDEFMGSTRDDLVERGKEVAAEQYEKGREVVKETAQQVESAVRDNTNKAATSPSATPPAGRPA